MKRLLTILTLTTLVMPVMAQNLTVTIDGWGEDSIHCMKRTLGLGNMRASFDTLIAKNGTVNVTNEGNIPMEILLVPTKYIKTTENSTSISSKQSVSAIVFIDQPTNVTGKFTPGTKIDYTISGNAFVEEKSRVDEMLKPYKIEISKLMERATAGEDIKEQYKKIEEQLVEAMMKYIAENPDSDVSAYTLTWITSRKDVKKGMAILTERVKNGVFKDALDRHVDVYITNDGIIWNQ